MIDYGGGIPSVDGIAAAFPHKILNKINGTPSRIDIDDTQEKQTEMRHHDLQQEEAARMDMQGWWYPLQDT